MPATLTDLTNALNTLVQKEAEDKALETQLINAMTSAFNRLLAKIAAGVDFQPQVNTVQTLMSAISASNDIKTEAIAEANVEGN